MIPTDSPLNSQPNPENELTALFIELDQKYWQGRLLADGWSVRFARLDPKILGTANRLYRLINIAASTRTSPTELRDTLLHEMIHGWLFLTQDPSHQKRNEGHGSAFKKEIDRLRSEGESLEFEDAQVICGRVSKVQLGRAAACYLERTSGHRKPDGKYLRRRWYPSADESQDCCKGLAEPTRKFPFTLRDHCCSITHVSRKYGVDTVALRAVIKEKLIKLKRQAEAQQRKRLAEARNAKLLS